MSKPCSEGLSNLVTRGSVRGSDPPGWGGQWSKWPKFYMFFRTQRTLSENILMIFDPLPVKFLPQKKLLVGAKNSLIFCSKLPRSQIWRYQKFLLHQKMAKEGSKNQIFFSEKIFERWEKKIWGPLGPYLPKIDFGGHVPDAEP